MNIKNILLMVLLIALVAGCNSSSTVQNYHVGTKGVTFQPLSSNPKELYEDETFALGLTLTNMGATDIKGATLLVNFDDYFLGLQNIYDVPKKITVDLPARSIENPSGGVDYFEYLFESKTLEITRSSVDTKINFNLCYAYSTDMTTEVCIDTLSRSAGQGTAVCKAEDYSGGSGQGAPIVIKKIEPEMLRVGSNLRPLFRIYIQNVGEGYTLYPEQGLCDNPTTNSDKLNKLKVQAWLSIGTELECTPEDIRLVDKETIVRCQIKDSDLGEYNTNLASKVTVLRVKVDYNYVDTYSSKLEIKRVNQIDIKSPTVCGFYEVQEGNNCVSLCNYCVKNPSSDLCEKNFPTKDFAFNGDFGCACDKQKCLALSKDGNCIFGYCQGNSYCCSTNECRDKKDGTVCSNNMVCVGGICSATKTECDQKKGSLNYTCRDISTCDNTTIITNLCPGDETNVCCKTKI